MLLIAAAAVAIPAAAQEHVHRDIFHFPEAQRRQVRSTTSKPASAVPQSPPAAAQAPSPVVRPPDPPPSWRYLGGLGHASVPLVVIRHEADVLDLDVGRVIAVLQCGR